MATVKKYAAGGKSSLGMKSVKAGFDKNPGVTRADIIVAGKGQAKKGVKMKKAKSGAAVKKGTTSDMLASYNKTGRAIGISKAKSGAKMGKKCRYGCK